MNVLSYSYIIIIDPSINEPGHGDIIFDRINKKYKRFLNKPIELLGNLGSKDISKIGMLPRASKDISIIISE